MIKFKNYLALVASLVFIPSCVHQNGAHPKGLNAVEIGMSKQQVRKILNDEGIHRGSRIGLSGEICEVIEYQIRHEISDEQSFVHGALIVLTLGLWIPIFVCDAISGKKETYCFGFVDGRLKLWGRPQDFQKSADHIQEFRLR